MVKVIDQSSRSGREIHSRKTRSAMNRPYMETKLKSRPKLETVNT